MYFSKQSLVVALALMGAWMVSPVLAQSSGVQKKEEPAGIQQPEAVRILDAAKAKLRGLRSLVVDFDRNFSPDAQYPTRYFEHSRRIHLERPNKFRVEQVLEDLTTVSVLESLSDGQHITRMNRDDHVVYERPVHAGDFFLGQNFLIQFFFDPKGIRFDPTDPVWSRPVSQFDQAEAAYDRDMHIIYLGDRNLERVPMRVIEIKYNTKLNDIRQHVYVGKDDYIYQVDTYFDGDVFSQKFRNFRVNQSLPADTWAKQNPANAPIVATDPARLGADAPEFTLPGADGQEYSLKEILKGKKGLYICALNAEAAVPRRDPDIHLPQMRLLQRMKDQYEKQGLAVLVIVGSDKTTPDMWDEILTNRLPDLGRFDYPVLIDVDLERGIQGAAYENYQIHGRNNILLDSKGRVVFASKDFEEKVNHMAFYQALGQLGFAVSPADMEAITTDERKPGDRR